MIKLGFKKMENVAILKVVEGSYDELIQINIIGLHGLGGFTIKETVHYLLGTKESGYVAYNFRSESELDSFKSQLKEEIKRINGGENGIIKMKYVLTNEVGEWINAKRTNS